MTGDEAARAFSELLRWSVESLDTSTAEHADPALRAKFEDLANRYRELSAELDALMADPPEGHEAEVPPSVVREIEKMAVFRASLARTGFVPRSTKG